VHVERSLEEAFGLLVVLGEERAAVKGHCACPGRAGAFRPGLVVVKPVARRHDLARTHGCLDPIVPGHGQHGGGRGDLACTQKRFFRAPELELEQRQRPVGE
jgi:hypothetical protein